MGDETGFDLSRLTSQTSRRQNGRAKTSRSSSYVKPRGEFAAAANTAKRERISVSIRRRYQTCCLAKMRQFDGIMRTREQAREAKREEEFNNSRNFVSLRLAKVLIQFAWKLLVRSTFKLRVGLNVREPFDEISMKQTLHSSSF